jgi:hypothetical protein
MIPANNSGMPIGDFPFNIEFLDVPVEPEPITLIAGDTLTWQRNFTDYSPALGWTLAYVLNSPTVRIVVNPGDITFLGNVFLVTIPSAETKTWAPGAYQWLAVVQLAAAGSVPAQRFTVALGRVIVEIDLLDATAPQDTRSPNEKALDNINLMLAGTGGNGVQEYTIAGRMLRRYSLTELTQLRSLYSSLVRQERANRGEYQLPTTVAVHFVG